MNFNRLAIGNLLGILSTFLFFYVFIKTGGLPVATKGPPMPLERFIVRSSLHAALKGAENLKSPVTADEMSFISGAKVYMTNCALCHGLPGGKPSAIATGLFPKAPQLFGDHGVTDDPIGKIYWKIKNGIRLTGMPGFEDSLSDTELWQVSELLLHADKLPASVMVLLTPKELQ